MGPKGANSVCKVFSVASENRLPTNTVVLVGSNALDACALVRAEAKCGCSFESLSFVNSETNVRTVGTPSEENAWFGVELVIEDEDIDVDVDADIEVEAVVDRDDGDDADSDRVGAGVNAKRAGLRGPKTSVGRFDGDDIVDAERARLLSEYANMLSCQHFCAFALPRRWYSMAGGAAAKLRHKRKGKCGGLLGIRCVCCSSTSARSHSSLLIRRTKPKTRPILCGGS